MKSYLITLPVCLFVVLHTADALSGLRYFRTSLGNVNSYRIRDTVPDSKNTNASPLPNDADDTDEAPQALEKLTSTRPQNAQKPLRGNAPPERLQSTDDQAPSDEQYYSDDATDAETIPQATPVNKFNSAKPNDEDYPDRQEDDSAFNSFGILENANQFLPNGVSPAGIFGSSDQPSQNGVSPAAINRLKQFASLTSVLANIARIPKVIALQIDTVISGLQKTYPTNTNAGAYMMGTRFLLRNQGALRPFDLMDRAGLGRLDQLVSSMPSIFSPLINALERVVAEISRRSAAIVERVRETARRISERASRSFAGFNVARNLDSYSISVPNVMDMVLKGRLAQKLDQIFAYLRSLIGSGLYNIGSSFVPSNPVVSDPTPARNPVSSATRPPKNQRYQMRTMPRFSNLRQYRPSRYFRDMEEE